VLDSIRASQTHALAVLSLDRSYVMCDVFLRGHALERLANEIKRQIIEFGEANARLAEGGFGQFLARLDPLINEALFFSFIAIDAHEVERHVILLRSHTRKGQRLFWIAVIPGRIDAVGDVVTDHAVLHALFEWLVEVLEDHLAQRLQRLAAIFGQRSKILFDSRGFALHPDMVMQPSKIASGPLRWAADISLYQEHTLRLFTIALTLAFIVVNTAIAQDVPSLPDQPHIVVVGTGTVEADADYLEVTIGVTATKESSSEAIDAVNEELLAIVNALLELDIEREDITVNAPRLDVEYDYEHHPPVAIGVNTRRTIDLVLRDIARYEVAVKTAAEHGATRIDEPTARTNDEAALSQQARQQAIQQARERADSLAKGFGHTLGPVHGVASGRARQWRWLVGESGGGLFGEPGGGREMVLTYTPRPVQRTEYVYAVFLLGPPLDSNDE